MRDQYTFGLSQSPLVLKVCITCLVYSTILKNNRTISSSGQDSVFSFAAPLLSNCVGTGKTYEEKCADAVTPRCMQQICAGDSQSTNGCYTEKH